MTDHEKNESYYKLLGIEYMGQQERTRSKYSLDMFNDKQTRTTFLRHPHENLEMAIERIRKNHTKEG